MFRARGEPTSRSVPSSAGGAGEDDARRDAVAAD